MTFAEIGRRLGISEKAAQLLFQSGMRKVLRRKHSLRRMQETVIFRQQLEDRRYSDARGILGVEL